MKLPKLEIKDKVRIKDIDGVKRTFEVGKHVELPQSNHPNKTFVLQEIILEDGRKEIRIGYYIIGKKPRMRGKWVWGQFCPFIPKSDLEKLLNLAKQKGII